MMKVALTGGIATGKSHVLTRIAAAGVPAIDADVLAREVVRPGTDALDAVASHFGTDILTSTGELDRRKLGAIVFADPQARRDLEAIVHPAVYRAIQERFARLAADDTHPFAVADIPLLYETGRAAEFDRVIVTHCPEAVQLTRLRARDHLSEEDARRRLAAQLPLAEKVARAHYAVDTSGTFDETNRQVDRVLRELLTAGS